MQGAFVCKLQMKRRVAYSITIRPETFYTQVREGWSFYIVRQEDMPFSRVVALEKKKKNRMETLTWQHSRTCITWLTVSVWNLYSQHKLCNFNGFFVCELKECNVRLHIMEFHLHWLVWLMLVTIIMLRN